MTLSCCGRHMPLGGSFSFTVAPLSRTSNARRAIFNLTTMPFLREFANEAVILLVIHVYFHTAASEDCEKALRQALVDIEHGKPCVYVGDHGLKYIGWHFPLNQRQQASAAFARLGADLEQFCKSPTTASDARCECSNVPCLTKQQMNKLVDWSVEQTLQDTLTLIPSFRKLCCALQRSIFLLTYASRGKIFRELALPDIEYHIEMQNWLGLSQLLDQTEWCRRYQDLCTEQMRSILDGCVGNGAQRGSRNKRQLNGKSNATGLATTCREGPSSTSTVKPTVTTDSIQSTGRFVNVKSYGPSLASMETSPVITKINCGDGSEHLQFPQGLSSTRTTNVQRMGSFSASGASFLVNVKKPASSQISLVESSVNRVSPSYQDITTRTSCIQISDMQKITHLSTSAGTFFFTVEPSTIHSSVGSFVYTLMDHRSRSTNCQFTPGPSPLQMPLVFPPSTSAGPMLTTGFIANLSSSTESLIKVSLFSLRPALSATGSSQGFVYRLSTTTPTDSVRRRVLKSPGVRKTNFEEASIGWPSSSAQSSLTERRVEPSSVFASKSLRHQSSPETRATVFLTFGQGKQTAFRVSHSVIRTRMTSSLNVPLPATTVPKRSSTPSSPGMQIKTRINISGFLWPKSQSSSPTIHVMYKDRSLGIKYESENQKTPSTVLLGISASSTPLLEEMSLYWTKASLRMSSYDKKSTIYSSLGSKPLPERSAFASKTSGPKLSGGVSLGQLVSTASSLAGDVPSKALKTSDKFEGLSTLIISRGQSSSPIQITVEFTTGTRQASPFGSSLLKLSHTSFLSLFETENTRWRSRTPQQTTLYHSNAESRTGITLSALSTTLAPSGGLSRGQVSLTPSSTSVLMKSNGSYSSHGTIQSEKMSSTMSLTYSKTAKIVHGVGLSSLITSTESAPPSLQRSSNLRIVLYSSPPIISKSSTRWIQKLVMASSSMSYTIRNDQSISSADGILPRVSSPVRLNYDASSGKLPATTQIFSSSSPFPDSQLLIGTTSFRKSSWSSSSYSKESPWTTSVTLNRTDIFSRQLAGKPLRSSFFTSPFVSSRSRVLFNTDETSEAHGISVILSTSVTESSSLFTPVSSSTNLGKTTKVFETRNTLSNVWGSNSTETLPIRPWNRSIEVQVTPPMSSTLTTESSLHSSLIMMGKPGKNSPRVSQAPYTLSSVGLGVSATEALYSRTWNTSWDPSLSPPPSEVPSQASSVSLQLTRGTKMVPSTGSFYETTSSSAEVIEASPLRSSLSSTTKPNSTNVGSGVSFTKRNPERLTSAFHSQTASQRTVSTLDHLFTKLLPSAVTRISVQPLTQSVVKEEAGSPMLPSSFNELFPTVSVLSSSSSAFESSSLVRATPLPSVATSASTSRFPSSELAAASSAPSPTKYDRTYLVILSGNCDMLDNRDNFSTLFKSALARLLSLHAADVFVRRISCGSVHVVFSVRDAKSRNITNKLEDLIEKKTFKFEYSNMTFIAEELSVVLKPSKTTTSRPSRTTRTFIPREKQIALIIFILFLSLFATASVLLTVIFCARFGCCQRREKRRKRRKRRKQTTPAEVELKVFSSLYSNLLHKVDYYGGSPQLTSPKRERREKPEEGEWDGDEDGPGTVTALLSKAQKVGDSEEKRFTFQDDDSCSSVLFY